MVTTCLVMGTVGGDNYKDTIIMLPLINYLNYVTGNNIPFTQPSMSMG